MYSLGRKGRDTLPERAGDGIYGLPAVQLRYLQAGLSFNPSRMSWYPTSAPPQWGVPDRHCKPSSVTAGSEGKARSAANASDYRIRSTLPCLYSYYLASPCLRSGKFLKEAEPIVTAARWLRLYPAFRWFLPFQRFLSFLLAPGQQVTRLHGSCLSFSPHPARPLVHSPSAFLQLPYRASPSTRQLAVVPGMMSLANMAGAKPTAAKRHALASVISMISR